MKHRLRNTFRRGSFFETMIVLETQMAHFISRFLCGEDAVRNVTFLHCVAFKEWFSLNSKIGVAGYILINHYPEIIEKDSQILKDLNLLRELRNHFAHSVTDYTYEGEDIRFRKLTTKRHKRKEEEIKYTLEDCEKLEDRALEIAKTFADLHDKMDSESRG